MLLSFSVSNYKSFKETKTLDLVATADKEHIDDNTFPANSQQLLKTIAVYGANASGKTNLLTSLVVMCQIVLSSTNYQTDSLIPVVPFMFDDSTQQKPSGFEVEFLINSIRYKYGFEATQTRVIKEWLYVYHSPQPTRWFEREFNSDSNEYTWTFSKKFKGQVQSWRKQTLKNTLFLSRASQLNSEQLQPVHQWFKNLCALKASEPINHKVTASWCLESEENKKRVLKFLKASGDNSGISDINVKEKEITKDQLELIKQQLPGLLTETNKDRKFQILTVEMMHGKIPLPFNEESAGTRKLFSVAKFWLETLEEGGILIIDELNNSMHPLLAKFLIQMFHDKEINKNGAQLIFTGHDSFLLDLELFRRDQIWFTEKNQQEASDLYSLADYGPRKKESIEKGYLKGRYGAIPLIDETILS